MVTTAEAIQILFKEYDTLRSELVARNSGSHQLMALGAGELALCIGWAEKVGFSHSLLYLGLFCVTSVAVLIWFLNREIHIVSARVQELENHINELAGVELICWENRRKAIRRKLLGKTLPPDPSGNPIPMQARWKAVVTSTPATLQPNDSGGRTAISAAPSRCA